MKYLLSAQQENQQNRPDLESFDQQWNMLSVNVTVRCSGGLLERYGLGK